MNSPRKPSRQDILRRQQQSTFVGREDQLASFRHNLTLSPEDWRFLFNVSGQGGVGKSTLLRQFRKIAEEAGFVTAYTSESENSVPDVMGQLVEQLERQGHKLHQFSERYRVYRQKKQELETDPDAPQGFSAFLGRSLAKAGLGLAKQVPGSGAVTPFLDEETIATQAGEWTSYVARKLGNKDEVRLVQEPVEVLTPLFLQDIGRIVEKSNLTLFFDTYERTSDFLDSWLREILEGCYGDLPINVIVVIAGREELSRNDWVDYEGSIARFSLEPFTEDEARQYLTRKGVTNPQVTDVILRLSGCLPLLVATLAVESPNDPNRIGDPSGTAVERFLKWVDDPKRRQVALDAALPRCLNRDIIAVLYGENDADELFSWLKQMPFVEKRFDGWAYHDIARTQMLRHKRLTSPQGWAELHGKLGNHYGEAQTRLQLDEEKQWRDPTWQTYSLQVLYHRLCESPQGYLSIALNEFLSALRTHRLFAHHWAETVFQAGTDGVATEVACWGEKLVGGLKSYGERRYEITAEMFTSLLDQAAIEGRWHPVALVWRGAAYQRMNCFEKALQDYDEAIQLDATNALAYSHRGDMYRVMGINSRAGKKQKMEFYQKACQDLTTAIDLNPKDEFAFGSRGAVYLLMQCNQEALDDLTRAIEMNPNHDFSIAIRGVTYQQLERHQEALQDFNRAIELNPSNGFALLNRGSLYKSMQCYSEALHDLSRALECELLSFNIPRAFCHRGTTYLMLHCYSEALIDLNHAIELDPENGWFLYSRALVYQSCNRLDDAKADLNRSIQLAQQTYNNNSENHLNMFNIALYHLVIGNIDQAKHFYKDALHGGASQPQIRVAIRDLEDFLRVFPKHEWAKKVKAVLERKLADE